MEIKIFVLALLAGLSPTAGVIVSRQFGIDQFLVNAVLCGAMFCGLFALLTYTDGANER